MATSPMGEWIRQHCRAAFPRGGAGMTDGQLLEAYVSRHDEASLTTLIQRHGLMVWGVCRRILGHGPDAEDAFQATFLVLVRKATSVKPREMVANWLYGVARQTALKARATVRTRQGRERQVVGMSEPAAEGPAQWDEVLPVLDEEIARLPEKYRAVIVLCDLECRTRKEVACQLGVPEGTVAGWVARARGMLAKRLAGRGVASSGGMAAAAMAQDVASAGLPTLVSSTITAARLFAAGQAATPGVISAEVVALTEGVLKTMLMAKLKNSMAMAVVVVMVGAGAGLLCYGTATGRQGDGKKGDATVPRLEGSTPKAQKDEEAIQGTWYVTAMEEGGKAQPKDRVEDVKLRLVVKGDKLSILTTTPDGRDVGQQGVTFTLDPKASPKRLDASMGGRTLRGIYAFDKGQLRLCIEMEGANRPSGFKTEEGSQQRYYILTKKDAATK